jgi:hypothetical protein
MWRAGLIGCSACGLVLLASACGSDESGGSPTTPPPATDLAPSQLTASTVAAPLAPGLCDPGRVRIEVVVPEPGVGQPDQIVELVNDDDRECDVDISATEDASPLMEPSVRLQPGAQGHVWVEGRDACDEPVEDPVLVLDVNGQARDVDVTFETSCGVEVTAFFTD